MENESFASPLININTVLLSFFHLKAGPIVVHAYSPNGIAETILEEVTNLMDRVAKPGIFTHQAENLTAINNFFEIKSAWARGGRETVMISALLIGKVSPDAEQVIYPWLSDFETKLKGNDEIFKGFYVPGEFAFTEPENLKLQAIRGQLVSWVNGLYQVMQQALLDDFDMKFMKTLNTLSIQQIIIIQSFIKPEGIKLLDAIKNGSKTREDISKSSGISLKSMVNLISLLISLDLITEGMDLVLTNRGKQVLNATNVQEKYQITESDITLWRYHIGDLGINVLAAVREGNTRDEIVAQFPKSKKIIKDLLNYGLIMDRTSLSLTSLSDRILDFLEKNQGTNK